MRDVWVLEHWEAPERVPAVMREQLHAVESLRERICLLSEALEKPELFADERWTDIACRKVDLEKELLRALEKLARIDRKIEKTHKCAQRNRRKPASVCRATPEEGVVF